MSAGAEEKNRNYVTVVREELQHYTHGLLRENEKLRAMATTLESDKRRLELEIIEARAVLQQKEELRLATESFESARTEFQMQRDALMQSRDAAVEELNLLRAFLGDVERENQSYAAQYIVVNLIGSEEVAIFELHEPSNEFRLSSSFGLDTSNLEMFKAGSGPIGTRLMGGEVSVTDHVAGGQDKLTACVPLKIGDRIIGAILVFRLLEHKQELQPVDHELFELLAVHASTALYCANLHDTQVAEVRG